MHLQSYMYAFTKLQIEKVDRVCVRAHVCVYVCVHACVPMCIRSSLHSVRFGHLLRCAHKRIVNIMKVYIERKNIGLQVELIRFRKKISPFSTLTFAKRGIQLDSCGYAWIVVTT